MSHEPALAEIRSALGPRGIVEGDDMAAFSNDVRGVYKGEALMVARPASTEEVSQVVRICARHGLAIVSQGGNTGLCGGSVPRGNRPSIILSLARMNKIISVNPESYTVTAEAGVILQAIHDAAAKVDRAFAMDWGARGSATVGGGISTNAGGRRSRTLPNVGWEALGVVSLLEARCVRRVNIAPNVEVLGELRFSIRVWRIPHPK
jgi:FAD/FMN-containing dehydrogenase